MNFKSKDLQHFWEDVEKEREKWAARPWFIKIKDKLEKFFTCDIPDFGREIKYAFQKIKKGYCDRDLWDIDYWFLEQIPKMLKQFNKNRYGHQPYLGYKVVNNDIIKTTEEISDEDEKKVINWLIVNMEKLYDMLENDYKYIDTMGHEKFEEKRMKLHNKVFKVFTDIFYSLWD